MPSLTRIVSARWFRPFRNAGVLALGRGVQGVMSLAYVVLASRALGSAEFGMLILLHTLLLFTTQLLRFQSWQAILKFGAQALVEQAPMRLHRIIFFALSLDIFSATVALLLLQLLLPQALAFVSIPETLLPEARWYAVSVLLLIVGSAPLGVLRLLDRHDMISWQTTVEPTVRLIGAVLLFLFEGGLSAFLLLWFAATLSSRLMLFVLAARALRMRRLQFSLAALDGRCVNPEPGIWRFAFGTNLVSTLNLSDLQLGPLLVGNLLGVSEAGLYRVAQQLSNVVIKPLNKLLVPAIYSDVSELTAQHDLRNRRTLVLRSALLAGGIAVAALLLLAMFGQALIGVMFGAEYLPAWQPMLWLTFAGVLASFTFPLAPLLIASGYVRQAVLVRLSSLTAYLVGFYLLVPSLGLSGAGVAVAVHGAVTGGLLTVLSRNLLRAEIHR